MKHQQVEGYLEVSKDQPEKEECVWHGSLQSPRVLVLEKGILYFILF